MFMNFEMYEVRPPPGYVKALKMLGRSDDPLFREKLSRLCNVQKDSLKGRTDFALIPFQELVTEPGVCEELACNALDADLIGDVLGRIGPTREGEHFIKLPSDFGLDPT